MKCSIRIAGASIAVITLVVGALLLFTPTEAVAKGKPKPPPCDCPQTIELSNGSVCELVDCGFDCVYECPFPG